MLFRSFVITHIGLLVLLAGCLMSQRGGIDAQIPILEGTKGGKAYEDSLHFEIDVTSSGQGKKVSTTVPFRSGPFNWREYGGAAAPSVAEGGERERSKVRRPFFPWRLSPRDTGVLLDDDGIRLEVLDFYADSSAALAPSVKLRIGSDDFEGAAGAGAGGGMWMPVDLSWQPDPLRGASMRHRASVGGGTVVFWKLSSSAEAEAFLAAVPDPALGFGARGQLVLVADGRVHRVLVDDLVGQPRAPLDGGELFVELTDFQDQLSAARLRVRRGADGAEIGRAHV